MGELRWNETVAPADAESERNPVQPLFAALLLVSYNGAMGIVQERRRVRGVRGDSPLFPEFPGGHGAWSFGGGEESWCPWLETPGHARFTRPASPSTLDRRPAQPGAGRQAGAAVGRRVLPVAGVTIGFISRSGDSTPLPSVDPHALTRGDRVLTVFPSPPRRRDQRKRVSEGDTIRTIGPVGG